MAGFNRTQTTGGALVFAAAAVSGAAGLAHQTVWIRALIDVLGAGADTFSKVIGAFFLGLAIGAWLASRCAARRKHWLWVAGAEAGVILLALPVLLTHRFAFLLYESGVGGVAAPWLLPLLLIAPPAIAMGVFLPWMIHALASAGKMSGVRPVLLYAVNTIGGIGGIACVLFWLFPAIGLIGTAVSVLALNAATILLVLLVHALQRGSTSFETETPAKGTPAAAPVRLSGLEKTLAFFSGFLVLAAEVLFKHQFAQISINSLYSAAVVLAVVLTALAAAPLVLPLLLRTGISAGRWLTVALTAAGLLFLLQPFHFMIAGHGLRMLPYGSDFASYSAGLFQAGLLYMGAPLFAAALLFPLLLYQVGSRAGRKAGPAVARLFLWNGLGGWVGAESVNLVIGPFLGLWLGMTAMGAIYLLLAGTTFRLAPSGVIGRRAAAPFATHAVAVLLVFVAAIPASRLPQVDPALGDIVEARLGREGVVAVVEPEEGNRRMVMNNSYVLGGSRAWAHQERQAHLPLLLHGRPESAAFIGVATGSTVAGATLHPTLESIEAIDLSPLTIEFAEKHFAETNRRLFEDPRLRTVADDARWVLARRDQAYDVVVGDLFLPWRTGTGRLYSVEHFQAVKDSLREDGIFCQWLPLYQLSREQFELIVETFRSVFPEFILIRGDFFHRKPIVGLVGPLQLDRHDWERTTAACDRLRDGNLTGDPLVRHTEGVAMTILGSPREGRAQKGINTLANARLELSAADGILHRERSWFTGLSFADFARDVQSADSILPAGSLRDAQSAGQFFLDLELAHGAGLSSAAELRDVKEDRLPEPLRSDRDANWQTWPGLARPNFP